MLALTAEATGLLLGGMATMLTAITAMGALLVNIKRGQKQIHVLVNSRLTEVTDRVSQLEAALVAAGITVPPDPANPTRPSGGTP